MYIPTAEQLAAFPAPNYVNPVTRGHELTVVNSVFLALATVFLGLRIYTRLFVRKWFGIDDVCIVLAYCSTVALNALTFVGIDRYGWNRHAYDIPITMASMSLKYAFFGKLLYILASMFTAYALIAFYYRLIAESGSHWFRLALNSVFVFNVLVWTSFFFAEIFICTPVSYYWTIEGSPSAKCFNEGPVTLAAGVIKTFIDLVITTLPLPLILGTEMRSRQRYMVSALFALGYVVTGAGAARVYYTYKVFYSNGDTSWWQYPTFITSTIENNLAIVCACAPTIRPLFPHFFGGPISRFRGWISTHNPSSNPSSNPSKQLSDPKRTSNISQLGTRIRSFGVSRSTESEQDNEDDMELVIQKNNEHSTAGTDRSISDAGFEFGIAEQQSSKDGVSLDARPTRAMSTITIGSGNSFINPFDPRLDVEDHSIRGR